MFTLAHLSDLHLPMPQVSGWRQLANKRILGYLSYQLRRKRVHRSSVIEALVDDLHRQAPDHIAITGDLTNIALPEEFSAAARWLRDLGPSEQVTVIPGNHDATVAVPWQQSLACWADLMSEPSAPLVGQSGFPFVRRRGPVALIGVSTACPSPPFYATGRVGADQLERLERVLQQLDAPSIFRVVLIHHPPIGGMMTHRKRLTDHAAFREVIARAGADLILHGHHHIFSHETIPTPTGSAAVIGAPSCSACRYPGHLHASYHLCRLTTERAGWRLEIEIRGLAETEDGFARERTFTLEFRDDAPCVSVSTAVAVG